MPSRPCDNCVSHGERLASIEASLDAGFLAINQRLDVVNGRLLAGESDIHKIKERCAAHQVMTIETTRERDRRLTWEQDAEEQLTKLKEDRIDMRARAFVIIFLGQVLVGAATLLLTVLSIRKLLGY